MFCRAHISLAASIVFAVSAATAAAQSPYAYAPQAPTSAPSGPSVPWQQLAQMPPGTLLLVHQRGSNWPIQCTLAWINPKSFACDTPATTAPAQRLTFPASSLESVQVLNATAEPLPPAPTPTYVQPQPQIVYTPPPPSRYVQPYPVAAPEHHAAGVVVLCAAAGGLLGGLVGKGWSTQAGFLGAGFGGILGGAIGFAAIDNYDHPHYMIRVPLSRSSTP